MADLTQIGKNIRLYRMREGLTQRALADNVLVSFQAISAWERGMSVPDLENAVRLANYFGVPVDALFAESESSCLVGIDGGGTHSTAAAAWPDGRIAAVTDVVGSILVHRHNHSRVAVLPVNARKIPLSYFSYGEYLVNFLFAKCSLGVFGSYVEYTHVTCVSLNYSSVVNYEFRARPVNVCHNKRRSGQILN